MAAITVNIEALLTFLDEDKSARRHSNAIKTLAGEELMLALVIEYMTRSGASAEIVSRTCTTGAKKGYQLDAWMKVQRPKEPGAVHYQVEVKSWSAHGVGGGSIYLDANANEDALNSYRRRLWKRYWADGRFVSDGLNKVLTPMKRPSAANCIRPLACLWAPVHPDGEANPWFTVEPTQPSHFREVDVFSASSFLRGVVGKQRSLRLELPQTAVRLNILKTLFVINDA